MYICIKIKKVMEKDITIGFKITPRIYLTIDGCNEVKMFEIDKIVSIETMNSYSIVTYNDDSGFFVQYTVIESEEDIVKNIENAKWVKEKCIEFMKTITNLDN